MGSVIVRPQTGGYCQIMRHAAYAFALSLSATSACNCGLEQVAELPRPEPIDETVATGAVEGRVCAADGETWLTDATISIALAGGDGAATRLSTVSDAEGRFRLEEIPPGAQTVHIEKGPFTTTRDVVVEPGLTVLIPEDDCALDRTVRIAVVESASDDDVAAVLVSLGVDPSTVRRLGNDWAEQLLSSDDGLAEVDMLFFNCRSEERTYAASPQMQERLRAFVARGGSVYASDQAYDLIELTFPDAINFVGDDTIRAAADEGAAGDVDADVLDSTLAAQLQSNTIPIHFERNTWSVIAGVEEHVEVYLRADEVSLQDGSTVFDTPLIVGFNHGDGRVIYSSFHEEPGVTQAQQDIVKLIMFEL